MEQAQIIKTLLRIILNKKSYRQVWINPATAISMSGRILFRVTYKYISNEKVKVTKSPAGFFK